MSLFRLNIDNYDWEKERVLNRVLNRSFMLIELLITICVLSILLISVVPSFSCLMVNGMNPPDPHSAFSQCVKVDNSVFHNKKIVL